MAKRELHPTSSFKKDLKKHYLKLVSEHWAVIITCLTNGTAIPAKYKDHALTGNYQGYRDCHIANDLVLIYKVDGDTVHLLRLNSHSEVFD